MTYSSIRLTTDLLTELTKYAVKLNASVQAFPVRYPDWLKERNPIGLGTALRYLLHEDAVTKARRIKKKKAPKLPTWWKRHPLDMIDTTHTEHTEGNGESQPAGDATSPGDDPSITGD